MREIHEIDRLEEFLERKHNLSDCVIEGLGPGETGTDGKMIRLAGSVLLGCRFPFPAFLQRLAAGRRYESMIHPVDSFGELVRLIRGLPPQRYRNLSPSSS